MSKKIKPIQWDPVTPKEFPCLLCRSGARAEFHVKIGMLNLSACWKCSQLSENELLAKLFKMKGKNK